MARVVGTDPVTSSLDLLLLAHALEHLGRLIAVQVDEDECAHLWVLVGEDAGEIATPP